jgi:hypothetical protein
MLDLPLLSLDLPPDAAGVPLWGERDPIRARGAAHAWTQPPPELGIGADAFAIHIETERPDRFHPGDIAFVTPTTTIAPGALVAVFRRDRLAGIGYLIETGPPLRIRPDPATSSTRHHRPGINLRREPWRFAGEGLSMARVTAARFT